MLYVKKSYYILIVLIAVLVNSCDRNDTLPEVLFGNEPIILHTHDVPNATKADENVVPFTENDFGLSAYYTNETVSGTMMAMQYVNRTTANDPWTYNPQKYWPIDGFVSFFGYYPYEDPRIDVSYSDGETKVTLLPSGDGTLDLLAASSTVNVDDADFTGIVPLRFEHITAKVRLAFIYDTPDQTYDYRPHVLAVKFNASTGGVYSSKTGWTCDTPVEIHRITESTAGEPITALKVESGEQPKTYIDDFTTYLPPTSISDPIKIVVDNQLCIYTPQEPIEITPGQNITLVFTIKREQNNDGHIAIFVTTFSVWEESEEIKGDLK